ncbi:biotin transporter BioY [Clostridium aminobutyricum]|uniref:Biotin transporter n=1 Tax=Clostridium aminobutyricum TaxID=33953 RepID=A0A939D794_CLOAM|nr:biotin transporter BioY [Clostridium aminobutyricum]MBN7772370.1 biotin transporter BioY [Clostridium aminobutyricum]
MQNQHTNTNTLTLIALMTAVICILGPLSIAIPISPVPISFTNLAIYFSAVILGWKKGTISFIVYLLIGFVGVPVFSNFTAGPAKLLGPTGGYLIGFIFMALITGLFVDKFPGKTYMYVIGMVIGTIITYVLGTVWLAYQANMTFQVALSAGVIPYIPGDIIKIAIATVLGTTIKKQVKRAGYL